MSRRIDQDEAAPGAVGIERPWWIVVVGEIEDDSAGVRLQEQPFATLVERAGELGTDQGIEPSSVALVERREVFDEDDAAAGLEVGPPIRDIGENEC